MMCFFQNTDPSRDEINNIADQSVNKEFDMAVFGILEAFI